MKGYAFLHRHLDETITDKLLNIASEVEWVPGGTGSGLNKDIRDVDTIPFNVHRHAWLAGILMYIAKIENKNFGYDISTISEIELLKYKNGNKYEMHQDVGWHDYPFQRKLTMIVQLSNSDDYEGGDLIFQYDNTNEVADKIRDKGSIIIFPSMMHHAITPITKGERLSLVTWIEGPAWR
jgi:PKHD-type hydroxylase